MTSWRLLKPRRFRGVGCLGRVADEMICWMEVRFFKQWWEDVARAFQLQNGWTEEKAKRFALESALPDAPEEVREEAMKKSLTHAPRP